jgi:hypothetical protein
MKPLRVSIFILANLIVKKRKKVVILINMILSSV